jgi:hypothetical protein
MCDYSLHTAKSRPARVGDRLVTRNFNTGTRGFAAPEDARTAVCVLPGTELAFDKKLQSARIGLFGCKVKTIEHTTAIFRQINKSEPRTHYDALEFPDGQIELLTDLSEGQTATVLQLPAQPATPTEALAQERVAYVANRAPSEGPQFELGRRWEARRAHGFQPPLPYGRVMTSKRCPSGSSK